MFNADMYRMRVNSTRTQKQHRRLLPGVVSIAWVILFWIFPTLATTAQPSDYEQAESMIRQGQWDAGITRLEPFLRAHPRDPKARNLMGLALTGKGDLAKANEQFREAVRINPQFYPALKNLAVNEFTLKDVAASERDFTAALKMAPDDPVIHTYLGEIAYRRSDYQAAAEHLSKGGKLVEKNPGVSLHLAESYFETGRRSAALELLNGMSPDRLNDRLEFQAGLVLATHGQFAQAVPYFRTLREHFPESYDVAYNLAVCYVESKQYPKAIELLNEFSTRGPTTAELENLLAQAYEGSGQTTDALETLRQATLLAPADEKDYLDFAVVCFDHDFYQLGLDAVNVGLRHLPQSDRLTFQRGVFEAMLGHYDSAEQDFEASSRLAPERELAYVGLGLTYLQAAHLPEALRVLRDRVKTKQGGNDSMVLYLLGEALIRNGVNPATPDFTEAENALEKSVQIQPNYVRSHIDLAKLYLMENKLDEAIRHLKKARELDPKEKSVYSHLAIAYQRQGNAELAKEMSAIMAKLNAEDLSRVYPVERAMKRGPAQGPAEDPNSKKPESEAQPEGKTVIQNAIPRR